LEDAGFALQNGAGSNKTIGHAVRVHETCHGRVRSVLKDRNHSLLRQGALAREILRGIITHLADS
jgi:hypothetical protein